MIAGLRRFVAQLREEGVAASPAECIDALRAIRLAGIEDRHRFRSALRVTLVKRSGQRATFDRVFDRFFVSPARGRRGRERPGPGGAGATAHRRSGRSAAAAAPVSRLRPPMPRMARGPADRDSSGEPEAKNRLKRLLSSAREGGPERRGRLRKLLLEQESPEKKAGIRQGRRPDPLRRELRSSLSLEEERELAEAVPRLIERIRLRTGRRRRRAPSGPVYLRRLFRENVAHGGVPFVLPRRRRRPRRPRVTLLVDVSWSCARSAALFLWMACAFLRLGSRTRVLFFVDRPVEATEAVSRWLVRGRAARAGEGAAPRAAARRRVPGSGIAPGGLSFDDLLRSIPQLNPDAASDYGRVFHRLLRSPTRPGGRDTVLVVLGDGRSNRLEPMSWALDEIAGRCAATLWLVPEPRAQWGSGDSALADFLPHADLAVEARDLAGLGRGVAELLRRL